MMTKAPISKTTTLGDVEQQLYQIADEAGLSIVRWDDEPLADFAHRLEEELAQKVTDYHELIDEVRDLDLESTDADVTTK